MPRRPSLFKERDVKSAAKAVRAAGLEITRIEIEKDGRIVIITTRRESEENSGSNEWDEVP